MFAGSGFVSHDIYLHGYFSASIKLPADYTAGVVVAFYVSDYYLFIFSFTKSVYEAFLFLILIFFLFLSLNFFCPFC